MPQARQDNLIGGVDIYLIVGIDPGIKTAYAAIGLDGKFISSGTLKGGVNAVVAEIVKLGVPSMIASDVNPAPSFVLKIAARFNVKCFVPNRVLAEREKSKIAGKIKNLHERDALAAAVKCYREYANRLRQIDKLETELNKDALRHMVLQGYSLANAIALLRAKKKGE